MPAVAGDQRLFDANARRFAAEIGVAVRVGYRSWEDLRPEAARAAEAGAGSDIVLGWLDDPHRYPEKLVDLSDVAADVGAKHGGWWEMCGRRRDGNWAAMPIAVSGSRLYCRTSWVREAGFEDMPADPAGFLRLCKALQVKGHPPGLALGNAAVDANGWTQWVLWAFGSAVVDEENRVVIDNPKTLEALEYAKELHATFIPGTLSWLDPDNNKAFLAGEIGLTHNSVSLHQTARNSPNPGVRAVASDMSPERPFVGPVGRPTGAGLVVNAYVFGHTKYPSAAKAYLAHMFDTEQYAAWLTASRGYWQPTLRGYAALPLWADPGLAPFRDMAGEMLWYGCKGELGRASSAVLADYVVVRMFATACSGARSPAEAAKEAQRRTERYYTGLLGF